jgi:hypothetical protein
MSESKAAQVPAPNVVSESSLRRKQQSLRDKSIEVPTVESILAEREAKKEIR